MKQKQRTKEQVFRSIPDGAWLTISADGESINAWRVRARETNRKDGYKHYVINYQPIMRQINIIANVQPSKQ